MRREQSTSPISVMLSPRALCSMKINEKITVGLYSFHEGGCENRMPTYGTQE